MNLGLHPLALAGATLSLGAHIAVFGVLFADKPNSDEVAVHLVDIEIAARQTVSQKPLKNLAIQADATPPAAALVESIETTLQKSVVTATSAPLAIEASPAPTTHATAIRGVTPPTVNAAPRDKPAPHIAEVASLDEITDVSATDAPAPSGPGAMIGVQTADGRNEQPRYPLAARKRGYEGQTIIRAKIGPSGKVLETEIAQSSGHHILDTAASKAVTSWQFRPAKRDGRAVIGQIEVPIEFRLR